MSTFSLTDETSIDVLIFWIQSADGSISFKEEETVKRVLDNMNYDLSTYHQTLSHLGAMSLDHMKDAVNDAVDHIKTSFSDDGQKMVFNLLDAIATCDAKIKPAEQEKLDHIKSEFGF
ncbi:MAG: hypothetical protein ACPGGA_11455 [Balneolaceae bacterium]